MRYIFKSKTGEVTHEITSSKPLKRREIKKQLKLSDKIAKAEAAQRRYEDRLRRKAESPRGRAKERRRILREVRESLPYYRKKKEKAEKRRKKRAAVLAAYRSARRKGGYSYGTRKKRRSKGGFGVSLGGYNF